MTAPSLGILDTFNRANGALGPNWSSPTYSGDSSPTIISNACGQSSGTSFADANWSAASFGPDSEVYATLSAVPAAANQAYLQARIQNPNNALMSAYTLIVNKAAGTDTVDLMRTIANVDTSIGTRSQEVAAGDAVGLVVLGAGATVTIQIWYKASGGAWAQLGADISDTDALRIVAAGAIGLGTQAAAARWDDFGGGTQVASAASAPLFAPRLPLALLAR